jgi:Protein of unknown function (DUF3043)
MFAPGPGRLIDVFRRRADTTDEAPQQTVKPGGKGRPTPKRRDAERRNRQPITAPRTRKEAYRKARERQASERQKVKEGMARGDDRYLPKRDRGPVRRLARDYVDSRRTVGEFFMYIALAALVLNMAAPLTIGPYMYILFLAMFIMIITESVYLSLRVKKLARERFPDEGVQGIGIYTVMRSWQIRRFRMPQPRLKPGQGSEI